MNIRTDKKEISYNEKVVVGETLTFLIPQCCREGWDSCKHVVKRQKKIKTNVGL